MTAIRPELLQVEVPAVVRMPRCVPSLDVPSTGRDQVVIAKGAQPNSSRLPLRSLVLGV